MYADRLPTGRTKSVVWTFRCMCRVVWCGVVGKGMYAALRQEKGSTSGSERSTSMGTNETRGSGKSVKVVPPHGDVPVSAEGETVETLAAKTDVRGRVKEKAGQVKEKVGEQAGQTAQAAKAKAMHAGERVRGTVSDLTDKARGAVTSEEATSKARRSGAGAAAFAAAAFAVWGWWRHRAHRNVSPWRKAARQVKKQVKPRVTKAKIKAKAQAKDARAKARAWR